MFVRFPARRHADRKDHRGRTLGINVSVSNGGGGLFSVIHRDAAALVSTAPNRGGIVYKRRTAIAVQSVRSNWPAPARHRNAPPPPPKPDSPSPPSNPHKSDLIRQLVQCELGVRKRIISKQRSSSPGFIGIRARLLCRI